MGALSGDEEERKQSTDDYQDFSERRKAFEERQMERMQSPQARAFMEQQRQRNNAMPPSDGDPFATYDDDDDMIQPGSGGGSRMAQMMAQAKQKQRAMGGMRTNFGMEQKFLDLDDDNEDDDQ